MQKINSNKRKIFQNILKSIKKNANEGLNEFYSEYGKFIVIIAKSLGCKQAEADSVVNKILVKVWRKVDSLFEIKNPEGWIYTVASNCAKDEVNVPWNLELDEKICQSNDCFEEFFSKDSFEYLISCLKEEEKRIFIMRYVLKSSFKEIAYCLEKPTPTISSIFYRALDKIKNFLENKKLE